MAIAVPVVLGMGGLALDVGQVYVAHSKLQAAVDAGALAGSLELPYDPDIDKGLVETAATNMVLRNYPDAVVLGVVQGSQSRSVCVTAEVTVDTVLMGAVGVGSETIEATACAGYNKLEIVLVIDNTGSMKGSPINEVKHASVDLVDLIIPRGVDCDTKVGLVPFRGKVRVGAGVDGYPAGCRNADGTLNQGMPDEFWGYEYRHPYNYRPRISETCANIPEIQPLTTERSTIISAINSQNAGGSGSGTVISEGIKWGRHVLTQAPPYTEGGDDEKYRKIMILLTDGDTEDGSCGGRYGTSYTPNNYWTNAYYGMEVTDCHCDEGGCLDTAMLEEAELTKAEDIEIFSIRYGNSDNNDVALMKAVASSNPGTDDHYYDAPSTADIEDVFKQIGKQLGWRLIN